MTGVYYAAVLLACIVCFVAGRQNGYDRCMEEIFDLMSMLQEVNEDGVKVEFRNECDDDDDD